MSRKKRHPEHANHERWLVSYADFITLMFAFFVVMFSSSQVDKRKVGKLALAMQVAFQQMGIFEASNTKMPLSTTAPMPYSEAQLVENTPLTEAMGRLVSTSRGKPGATVGAPGGGYGRGPGGRPGAGPGAGPGGGPGLPDLDQLRREIERALAPQLRLNEVAIEPRGDGMVLSLREVGFFDSGSATLKEGAEPAISKLAAVLLVHTCFLRIEGHTDNVPIHSSAFASNWELSTARATNMISLFTAQYRFDPARLSAGGYAEFHPAASNDTPEGRALNRRVDIVILPPEDFSTHLAATSIIRALPPKGGK
ncbi:MAG TPA: flagellar motor protein MotB [Terriglobia bacterium]|nr:flagellar motor protein MotB [Terriglobia bacterium]